MTPSATAADRSDSMAPSMAMVNAMGSSSWRVWNVKAGMTMSGSWAWIWKRSPMVSMPVMPA